MNVLNEGKKCGECSLCCKTMAIDELSKPKDLWCQHVVQRMGCSIYAQRPPSCQAFQCVWLADPTLPEAFKPNKAKFVIVGEGETQLVVHADPNNLGNWRREPYYSYLKSLASRGLNHGGVVSVLEKGRTIVLLPDREVPLGVLAADDRVVVSQSRTSAGSAFDVKVMKAAEADKLGAAGAGWKLSKR